jgi:hypothetical protein
MDIITALFVIGTLGFWITLTCVSALIIAFDYNEREGASFATLALFAFGVVSFNPSVLSAVRANPVWLVVGVLVYLVLGVLTAVAKWYFFLLNARDVIKENSPRVHSEQAIVNLQVRGRRVKFPIKVADHKARIIGWMTVWPWVAGWTLIDDPIRRMFQRIYVSIAGRLQQMVDHIVPPLEIVPPVPSDPSKNKRAAVESLLDRRDR